METNASKIEARIAELIQDKAVDSVRKVKAFLTIEGFKPKEIDAAVKKAGLVTVRKGFAAEYYDWLASEARTVKEAKAYIENPRNSQNVKRHLSHYLNIAKLAIAIREGGEIEMEEEGETTE